MEIISSENDTFYDTLSPDEYLLSNVNEDINIHRHQQLPSSFTNTASVVKPVGWHTSTSEKLQPAEVKLPDAKTVNNKHCTAHPGYVSPYQASIETLNGKSDSSDSYHTPLCLEAMERLSDYSEAFLDANDYFSTLKYDTESELHYKHAQSGYSIGLQRNPSSKNDQPVYMNSKQNSIMKLADKFQFTECCPHSITKIPSGISPGKDMHSGIRDHNKFNCSNDSCPGQRGNSCHANIASADFSSKVNDRPCKQVAVSNLGRDEFAIRGTHSYTNCRETDTQQPRLSLRAKNSSDSEQTRNREIAAGEEVRLAESATPYSSGLLPHKKNKKDKLYHHSRPRVESLCRTGLGERCKSARTDHTSESSSLVSELDEADNEVRNLTASAFRSLSRPQDKCIDIHSSTCTSSSNFSQSLSEESSEMNKWSAYIDLANTKLYSSENELSDAIDETELSCRLDSMQFECIDVMLENQNERRGRSEKRTVPKRQIQLKRRDKTEPRGFKLSSSTDSLPVGSESSDMQTEEEMGLNGKKSVSDNEKSKNYGTIVDKNFRRAKSLDEPSNKAKIASHLIKNVLTKKIQYEQQEQAVQCLESSLTSAPSSACAELPKMSHEEKTDANKFQKQISKTLPDGLNVSHSSLSSEVLPKQQDSPDEKVNKISEVAENKISEVAEDCNSSSAANLQGVIRPCEYLGKMNFPKPKPNCFTRLFGSGRYQNKTRSKLVSTESQTEDVYICNGMQWTEKQEGQTEDGIQASKWSDNANNVKLSTSSHDAQTQAMNSPVEANYSLISANEDKNDGNVGSTQISRNIFTSKSPGIKLQPQSKDGKKNKTFTTARVLTPSKPSDEASRVQTVQPRCQSSPCPFKPDTSELDTAPMSISQTDVVSENEPEPKAKKAIHQVRDIRKLVKNNYTLSFKAAENAATTGNSYLGSEEGTTEPCIGSAPQENMPTSPLFIECKAVQRQKMASREGETPARQNNVVVEGKCFTEEMKPSSSCDKHNLADNVYAACVSPSFAKSSNDTASGTKTNALVMGVDSDQSTPVVEGASDGNTVTGAVLCTQEPPSLTAIKSTNCKSEVNQLLSMEMHAVQSKTEPQQTKNNSVSSPAALKQQVDANSCTSQTEHKELKTKEQLNVVAQQSTHSEKQLLSKASIFQRTSDSLATGVSQSQDAGIGENMNNEKEMEVSQKVTTDSRFFINGQQDSSCEMSSEFQTSSATANAQPQEKAFTSVALDESDDHCQSETKCTNRSNVHHLSAVRQHSHERTIIFPVLSSCESYLKAKSVSPCNLECQPVEEVNILTNDAKPKTIGLHMQEITEMSNIKPSIHVSSRNLSSTEYNVRLSPSPNICIASSTETHIIGEQQNNPAVKLHDSEVTLPTMPSEMMNYLAMPLNKNILPTELATGINPSAAGPEPPNITSTFEPHFPPPPSFEPSYGENTIKNETICCVPKHEEVTFPPPPLHRMPTAAGLHASKDEICSESGHETMTAAGKENEMPQAMQNNTVPNMSCFPFLQTQRKILIDPDSGKYYYVDAPVQPQLKMLYDPETGQYMEVFIPQQSTPPHGSPYPSPMTPYVMNPGCYGSPYIQYPGYAMVPSPVMSSMHPETHNTSSQSENHLYREMFNETAKQCLQNIQPADGSYMESLYYIPNGIKGNLNSSVPSFDHMPMNTKALLQPTVRTAVNSGYTHTP
ncbi:proline-rich basic protein 1 [Protopterus annectens]|uniref:proline-rich basic protein 1 n=1 Tax=Protopterus annectens TaxID=7888 RepID=UPI001CFC0065|nr:proline-rich basic protein 1 [Protopterus annectens]